MEFFRCKAGNSLSCPEFLPLFLNSVSPSPHMCILRPRGTGAHVATRRNAITCPFLTAIPGLLIYRSCSTCGTVSRHRRTAFSCNYILLFSFTADPVPQQRTEILDTMDKLPQEIIDRISSYLIPWYLRSTLTVNSKFQASAERYSGAYEEFHLDESTADKFLRTFSGRRFRYLRHVSFQTRLYPNDTPPNHKWFDSSKYLEDDIPKCRESKETLREYDKSFTAQIGFLFDTLSTVERRVGTTYRQGKIDLTILTPIMDLDPSIYCPFRGFVSHRVHLIEPMSLPVLNSIRRLRFENGTEFFWYKDPTLTLRKIDLRALLDIAYKLPNLENLACEIGGDEWPTPYTHEVSSHLWHMYQGPRRDSRHDFAKNMNLLLLPKYLRELDLNFIHPHLSIESIDQTKKMPNLTFPFSYDPFSTSLRTISYHLRRMRLFAVVDETLFWPADGGELPAWPQLESLDICFHFVSPSGRWYFKGLREPEEGQLDGYVLDESAYPPFETTRVDKYWCDRHNTYGGWEAISDAQFRVVPDDEAISPLLEAFAKAAVRMPKLKDAALWCPLYFKRSQDDEGQDVDYLGDSIPDLFKCNPETLGWGIAYMKPYQKVFSRHVNQEYVAERQLWWMVGNRWRPSADLQERFREVGREKHGNGLVEHWSDEHYGDGLVDRKVFEEHQQTTRTWIPE